MGAVVQPITAQWLTIPITSNVPGGDSDTGIDLPLGALVVGAGVTVTTPDNMAVSAGFTGDVTAWLSSILVDTAGFLLGVAGAGGGSLLHADSRFTPIFITAARRRVWLSALEQSPWRGSVHILYFNPPA